MEIHRQIHSILYPANVAVIGASRKRGKIGNVTFKNLIYGKCKCTVFPVNPKAKKILGVKCFPRVSDIPFEIDLGVIVVPATIVPSVMKDCADKGVKGVIIITSGFSEIGREDLEKEVKEIARKGGIRIIGPNTLGVINTFNNLNASFAKTLPLKGEIAFITQSGALGEALMRWTVNERVGLSKVVALGNKMDIDDADLISYLENDDNTRVIAMYIESIKNGRKFMEAASKVSKKKAILALKAGRSEAGRRATASHTGALGGRDKVYDAAFKQSGVIRVQDTVELFDMALALSRQPPAKGNRIGVVTNGGGAGIMTADVCETKGIEVPKFEGKLLDDLRRMLPEIASPYNPVDVLGDADYHRYRESINRTISSRAVAGVIAIHVQTHMIKPLDVARAIVDATMGSKKPVISTWIGGKGLNKAMHLLKDKNIPSYPNPRRAVAAMSALIRHGENS